MLFKLSFFTTECRSTIYTDLQYDWCMTISGKSIQYVHHTNGQTLIGTRFRGGGPVHQSSQKLKVN